MKTLSLLFVSFHLVVCSITQNLPFVNYFNSFACSCWLLAARLALVIKFAPAIRQQKPPYAVLVVSRQKKELKCEHEKIWNRRAEQRKQRQPRD